jgi:hypothetical protein
MIHINRTTRGNEGGVYVIILFKIDLLNRSDDGLDNNGELTMTQKLTCLTATSRVASLTTSSPRSCMPLDRT